MFSTLKQRLQDLWVQNSRNRILITVGTCAVVILLLCGCLNLMGTLFSGALDGLTATGPVARPTLPSGTQQVANINPTFPLPPPTVYPNPNTNNGGTPVPSSNTPPPTPTESPTPVITPTPTGGPGGGGGTITFTLSPDPNPQHFQSATTNQIMLSGPPGTSISVSVYLPGNNSCVSMNTTLDGSGQATLTCHIPGSLKGNSVTMAFIGPTIPYQQYPIPVD